MSWKRGGHKSQVEQQDMFCKRVCRKHLRIGFLITPTVSSVHFELSLASDGLCEPHLRKNVRASFKLKPRCFSWRQGVSNRE